MSTDTGSADVVTQLQGIVKQFSTANQEMLDLIAAVQGRSAPPYTVGTLPTPTGPGLLATVSDGSPGQAWGAAVTAGGTTPYLVWFNGSAWTVIGQ